MMATESDENLEKGMSRLEEGDTLAALVYFEKTNRWRSPAYLSCLGYCLAKERGQIRKGENLCLEALDLEPLNTLHHLNLGRVYLLAKRKEDALRVLREAASSGRGSKEIFSLLECLGTRKSPPLPFLSRNNPLNKYTGILLARLGLR